MRSIHSRLKKLKTHKRVCSLLFSLILGLGLFGGLSLGVFADEIPAARYSFNPTTASWQRFSSGVIYTTADGYESSNNVLPKVFSAYEDITIVYSHALDLASIWNYLGNGSYSNTWGYQFYGDSNLVMTVTPDSNTLVSKVEYLGFESNLSYSLWNDYGSLSTSSSNNVVTLTQRNNLFINGVDYLPAYNAGIANQSLNFTFKYRIHYVYRNANTGPLGSTIQFTMPTGTKNSNFKICIFPSTSNIINDQSDVLANDWSGTSDNLNAEVTQAAAVESAADGAISNALPDADNELDDILDYDYSSIGTDNLTALSFWKQLGDYVLSNSNLVGIGALLIGCLFLGFVIYLLRL